MGAAAAIAALTAGAEPRTWSLLVTIFGDMARAPGATIPGPVLSAITGRIGIRPEAMRVALHRLRKDDWLASEKQGRVSRYRLTPFGRAETATASARIYATAPADPGGWTLLIAGPGEVAEVLTGAPGPALRGCLSLVPGAWLCPGTVAPPRGTFGLHGQPSRVPGWLKAQLMPPELAGAYADFAGALATAGAALGPAPPAPLDRAALRVLVVHGWRRLVLRHPDLPDAFFPSDWAGLKARAEVFALLERLGQPSLAEIAEAVDA